MDMMRLQEAELRVKEVHDHLKTGPERAPTIRVLDDLHGFWKSRMVDWVHDEDLVHAYNSLREHAGSLERGEDVMGQIRAAVDRLLVLIRAALARGTTTPS
jgi:hypothetical protein